MRHTHLITLIIGIVIGLIVRPMFSFSENRPNRSKLSDDGERQERPRTIGERRSLSSLTSDRTRTSDPRQLDREDSDLGLDIETLVLAVEDTERSFQKDTLALEMSKLAGELNLEQDQAEALRAILAERAAAEHEREADLASSERAVFRAISIARLRS